MGFIPTTPQKLAGWRTEPPVSVPMARMQQSAPAAAAEPPLDPPGTRSRSQGLRLGPNALFSVEEPMANSSMFALPTNTRPARLIQSITVAS